MFAKKAFVLALLSISLSASAAPAADCTITQTVTAKSTATSAVLVGGKGGFGGNSGNNAGKGTTTGNSGKGTTSGNNNNNNSGSGAAATGNNSGNTGSTGTSSSSSSTSTSSTSSGSTSSNNSGSSSSSALQSSLSLDPSLVQTGFAQNGQVAGSDAGQVASATSENNFINFCATSNLPLTNGTQIKTGSCNGAPMGLIAATTAMPSAKFVFPKNLDTIQANTNFTVQMAINNLNTGFFVNPNLNFFAAPQDLASNGMINGHSHVVIEAIDSITSTAPTDPTKFNFFKGLNAQAVNGILTAEVAGGLPAGTYKMSSINSAANHQPVLVAVAQHGSLDDAVYFTVTDNGQATGSTGSTSSTGNTGSTGSSTSSAAATSASTSAGKTTGKGKGTTGKGAAKGKRWLWE